MTRNTISSCWYQKLLVHLARDDEYQEHVVNKKLQYIYKKIGENNYQTNDEKKKLNYKH